MKTLFQFITETKKTAEVVSDGVSNPNNPDILIKNVGKKKLKDIKHEIKAILEKMLVWQKTNNYHAINSVIGDITYLKSLLNAVTEAEDLLNSSSYKRKIAAYNRAKEKKNVMKNLKEVAPPDPEIENWIKKVKPEFKKRYKGDWEKVLYSKAWSMYKEKHKK